MIKRFNDFDIFSKVLVTIPHGGTLVPKEIDKNSLSMYQNELNNYCIDRYSIDLYNIKGIMKNQEVVNPISNVILNVNRNPNNIEDCVPDNYDNIPIYKKGLEPDYNTKKLLVDKYHIPFHEQIKSKQKIFILDGHTTKTGLKDLAGRQVKKDIIVSNWQNSKLDPKGGIFTCPDIYIDCYLEELDKRLLNHRIERITKEEIEKNTEYYTTYGHIESEYGINDYKFKGYKAPLIFQETNEDLYIENGKVNYDKIKELNLIIAESMMSMISKMKKYLI